MDLHLGSNIAGYLGLSKSNLIAETIKLIVPKSLEKLVDMGAAAYEVMQGMSKGDLTSRLGSIAHHAKSAFSTDSPATAFGGTSAAGGVGFPAILAGGLGVGALLSGGGLLSGLTGGGGSGGGGTPLTGLASMMAGPLAMAAGLAGITGIGSSTPTARAAPAFNMANGLLTGNFHGGERLASRLGMSDLGTEFGNLPPGAMFEDFMFALLSAVVKKQQQLVKAEAMDLKNDIDKAEKAKQGGGGGGGVIGGATSGTVGAVTGTGGAATATDSGIESRSLKFENLKNMMNKMSEMQSSMSNILNSMHEAAKSTIQNIR
jgi:hypothetical protein